MRRKGKYKEDVGPGGAPLWMVTYGDMMTLLMVFFVLIVSFSTVEIRKFKAAIGSVRGAIMPWAPAPSGASMMEQEIIDVSDRSQQSAAADAVTVEVEEIVDEMGLSELVEVHQTTGGVRIILTDPVLFEEGEDNLKPIAYPILESIMSMAKQMEVGEIEIEGHTDDTPINTVRFPSNWDLSAARALSVLKFYQSKGFEPHKLVSVGFGEYRPKVILPPDANKVEKAPNRRVEIFLNMQHMDKRYFGGYTPYAKGLDWGD